jgi:Rrf2 family protein
MALRQQQAQAHALRWQFAVTEPKFSPFARQEVNYRCDRVMPVLTRKSKYGLKALLVLAEEADHGPVLIAELAERQRLPKKFLEAILLELKRAGLLHSKKGKGGGYVLGRKPTEITVGQVIRVLEGPLALTPCVSQTAYRRCDECPDEEACGVRLAMKKVRDATARILDNTTLTGLNAQVARACTPASDRGRHAPSRRKKSVAI